MAPRKDFKFTFPFEPPWEDLRKTVVTSNGVKCYIFDTCVVTDPEERAQIDRNIADIIIRNDQRKFLKELERQEREEQNSIRGGEAVVGGDGDTERI